MNVNNELKKYLLDNGASDVGFAKVPDGTGGMKTAVSIVFKLSDAIVDEIDKKPTYTYFHHYRTVNAFLDSLALKCGVFLQEKGYKYIPIAASQSINEKGFDEYKGRYSHKKAAYFAGLGTIGKNMLFIHKDLGVRVRFVTVFTDAELTSGTRFENELCSGCDLCIKSCPANALSGKAWWPGIEREELFDPAACSAHMKNAFHDIGRGAVCGICMKVCKHKNT